MSDLDVYEYIATEDIYVGTVLAFRDGDPVPADNVKAHGYLGDGSVVKRKDYKPKDGSEPVEVSERGVMPQEFIDKAKANAATEEKKSTTPKAKASS